MNLNQVDQVGLHILTCVGKSKIVISSDTFHWSRGLRFAALLQLGEGLVQNQHEKTQSISLTIAHPLGHHSLPKCASLDLQFCSSCCCWFFGSFANLAGNPASEHDASHVWFLLTLTKLLRGQRVAAMQFVWWEQPSNPRNALPCANKYCNSRLLRKVCLQVSLDRIHKSYTFLNQCYWEHGSGSSEGNIQQNVCHDVELVPLVWLD